MIEISIHYFIYNIFIWLLTWRFIIILVGIVSWFIILCIYFTLICLIHEDDNTCHTAWLFSSFPLHFPACKKTFLDSQFIILQKQIANSDVSVIFQIHFHYDGANATWSHRCTSLSLIGAFLSVFDSTISQCPSNTQFDYSIDAGMSYRVSKVFSMKPVSWR